MSVQYWSIESQNKVNKELNHEAKQTAINIYDIPKFELMLRYLRVNRVSVMIY